MTAHDIFSSFHHLAYGGAWRLPYEVIPYAIMSNEQNYKSIIIGRE